MASITDPAVNNWASEEVRPLAETLERLKIALDSMNTRYTQEVSGVLATYASDDELDARAAEGVPVPTKDELVTWVSNAQAVLAALDVAGRMDVLTFPAVRPPV